MAVVSKLAATTIDCPEPGRLADFYQALTGWEKTHDEEGYAAVQSEGGAACILFQRVESYTAPVWPDQAHLQQLHLDFIAASDLDSAQAAAVELGARAAEHQPQPDRWRIMLDPVGHPFCLCVA